MRLPSPRTAVWIFNRRAAARKKRLCEEKSNGRNNKSHIYELTLKTDLRGCVFLFLSHSLFRIGILCTIISRPRSPTCAYCIYVHIYDLTRLSRYMHKNAQLINRLGIGHLIAHLIGLGMVYARFYEIAYAVITSVYAAVVHVPVTHRPIGRTNRARLENADLSGWKYRRGRACCNERSLT